MYITIENEYLKVGIKSLGAELDSLVQKKDGQEYMWEADPKYWNKTSPFLFPFIGKLEDFRYRHQGKTYDMVKHGFARDMDFMVVSQERDRVVFSIENTKETFQNYPFIFRLEISFRLEEQCLYEEWSIHNYGEEKMFFAIGGHPAFATPLLRHGRREGKRTDCAVKLHGTGSQTTLQSSVIDISAGLTNGETFPVVVEEGVFPIMDHMFDQDALVFANQGVTGVSLLDEVGKEYVRLDAINCPVWGIWSMSPSDCGYVCIEPWWGICGAIGENKELGEREYINVVEPGKIWKDGFCITIL